MRKITREACQAIEGGYFFKSSNTTVQGGAMLLHGNEIARKSSKGLEVTLAGWNSNTTRERLNGLKGVRVSTKQGQAMLNGKKWSGDWVNVGAWDGIMECDGKHASPEDIINCEACAKVLAKC